MIPRLSFLGLQYIVLHIKMHIFTYESARIHTSYTESLASCSRHQSWRKGVELVSPVISGWWFQPTLWKMMEFVSGKDDIPYMKWKMKFMFQTTNQIYFPFKSSIQTQAVSRSMFLVAQDAGPQQQALFCLRQWWAFGKMEGPLW